MRVMWTKPSLLLQMLVIRYCSQLSQLTNEDDDDDEDNEDDDECDDDVDDGDDVSYQILLSAQPTKQ